MAAPFLLGQTDVTVYFRAYLTSDGSEKTDVAFNTSGFAFGYVRERQAEVEAVVGGGTAPVTLAADDTAHTDWGWRNVVGNLYRADYPDTMAASSGSPKFVIPYARLSGTTFVQVDPNDLAGSDPRAAATTTTQIRDAVLNWEPYTGYSLARLLRAMGIVLRGTASGLAGTSATYTAPAGGATVTATVDANGNRTAVTDTASGAP